MRLRILLTAWRSLLACFLRFQKHVSSEKDQQNNVALIGFALEYLYN